MTPPDVATALRLDVGAPPSRTEPVSIELAPFRLRLRAPLTTARGVLAERAGYVLTLRTADGVGRGEATPLEDFGTESLEASMIAARSFRLTAPLDSVGDVAGATVGLAATPAARFAVECALLEVLARRRRLSVAALLGATRRRVPVGALIDGPDAASLARAAERAAADGFRTVKVKLGRHLSVDAQRVQAVRRAVGAGVKLRVDANGAWTEGAARAALRGLESLGLELCEQPVAPREIESLRRLRGRVPCAVAADESVVVEPRRLLELDPGPAVDVVVLKPAVLGGLLPALALARAAAAAGVGAYVTTSLDGPRATAAAAHLAMALPEGPPYAHGLATGSLFEGWSAGRLSPVGGELALPEGVGWCDEP